MNLLWNGAALHGCKVDVVCYNAAMAACHGKWVQAVALLHCLDGNLASTRISFNTGISACCGCWQWSHALSLLDDMQLARLQQDVLILEAVVIACRSSNKFLPILDLLQRLKSPERQRCLNNHESCCTCLVEPQLPSSSGEAGQLRSSAQPCSTF